MFIYSCLGITNIPRGEISSHICCRGYRSPSPVWVVKKCECFQEVTFLATQSWYWDNCVGCLPKLHAFVIWALLCSPCASSAIAPSSLQAAFQENSCLLVVWSACCCGQSALSLQSTSLNTAFPSLLSPWKWFRIPSLVLEEPFYCSKLIYFFCPRVRSRRGGTVLIRAVWL